MSTTYRPHANDTLYNVLFTEFAEGRVDLNLDSVMNQIQIVQGLLNGDYIGMFEGMLDQKYGRNGAKRRQAEDAILARKNGLLEEYRRFFGELVRRRHEVLAREGRQDNYENRLDDQGRFNFGQ